MRKKHIFNKEIFLDILNVIFHPVFLPTYLMIWYFFNSTNIYPIILAQFIPTSLKIQWILLYASLNSIMPIVILVVMKNSRLLSSIRMDKIKERRYFFLIIGTYYWLLFYLFREQMYSRELFRPAVLITGVMSVTMFLLSLLTTSKIKISLHSAGYGILTGLFVSFTFLFQHNFLPEIRLLSKAHQFTELISGWILGLLSCIVIFLTAYQYFETL